MDMALRNAKQHQVLSLASAAPSQHSILEVVVTMQNNFRSYLSAKQGRDFAGRQLAYYQYLVHGGCVLLRPCGATD
jgi:hypothetical protein